jgi:hypothetical protein
MSSVNINRYQLSGQDEPVNTCQKHSGIAYHLASICARPDSNALVIGAGSGSDVIGCLRAGVNVVAVDKDATQFQWCKARLLAYITGVQEETKIEARNSPNPRPWEKWLKQRWPSALPVAKRWIWPKRSHAWDLCSSGQFLHEHCLTPCVMDECDEYFCCQRHLEEHQQEDHV